MSINAVAKSLAKVLISTSEYRDMKSKKANLYNHPNYGEEIKHYETVQLQIINMDASPARKQSLMKELKKQHQKMLSSKYMQEYQKSISDFQEKTFHIFDQLNKEIGKIVN